MYGRLYSWEADFDVLNFRNGRVFLEIRQGMRGSKESEGGCHYLNHTALSVSTDNRFSVLGAVADKEEQREM